MKQETLEETAENAFNDFQSKNLIVPQKHILPFKLGYIEGAKWQAQRMYSEEEVERLLITQRGNCYVAILSDTKDQKLAELASKAPEPWNWRK